MSERLPPEPALKGLARRDEPMAKHVSWRAGGRARLSYRPVDVEDLARFLRSLAPGTPLLFVGLGSNLLVRDGGFDGAVVFTHHALGGLEMRGSESFIPKGGMNDSDPHIHAGAGVPAPHVARYVAKHGGGGAEWMAGVPGTVGGALAMNAGCYGGETWNHVVAVETIDRGGSVRERGPADFETGYRHVRPLFAGEEWFVGARLRFGRGEEKAAMARIRDLLARRVASQPLNVPNAGSVFRNPPGDHAARLIESCGLKGFRVGAAEVSAKHANFILNTGGAAAADIEAVIEHVHATVAARCGVDLVREVRIVGEPAPPAGRPRRPGGPAHG